MSAAAWVFLHGQRSFRNDDEDDHGSILIPEPVHGRACSPISGLLSSPERATGFRDPRTGTTRARAQILSGLPRSDSPQPNFSISRSSTPRAKPASRYTKSQCSSTLRTQGVTLMIRALEKDGLVTRKSNPLDGRSTLVRLRAKRGALSGGGDRETSRSPRKRP